MSVSLTQAIFCFNYLCLHIPDYLFLYLQVESGMGTVPLPDEEHMVQTWDGVIAGTIIITAI